jgi:SAM-dependent methyltransferase
MTLVIAAATQEPAFVGWVAVLSVLIFMAVTYLVLVVAVGGEGVPIGWTDERPVASEPVRPAPAPVAMPAAPALAVKAPDTFALSMAIAMRGIAAAVVQRASVQPGERILDGGSGIVIVASPGLVSGRTPLDVDPASGTLAIGRRVARGARTAGAEFAPLEFASGWFNVVVAVHTLHFAADPVGVLAEWRRVTGPGGRLSISVPGPRSALGMNLYDPIHRRHDAGLQVHLPTRGTLAGWAERAGWLETRVFADPGLVIRLTGPESFRTWMQTRPWSDPDQALSPEQSEALERDLLAATSIGPDGRLQIPFGALYLTGRNP